MKQRRFIIILSVAIVLGGVAGLLALRYLTEQATPLMATEAPSGQLVVAATDLPLGTLLRAEDVRVIDWHSNILPIGYYASPAEVIGRGLITPVSANEPLMAAKLADIESGGGLSIVIPAGMRAVPVRVDEVIGIAGFVLPGTRVDVLLTITPQRGAGSNEDPMTRIILQNIHTLASGQTIQQDANGTPQTVSVVTLLVNPDQAERLTLAANEGRIQLALRNTLDMAEVVTQGIRTTALIAPPRSGAPTGSGTAVRVAAPAARSQNASTTVIEMYKGGERTLSTFQTQP
jgi:pilus assembly protein CpaB